MSFFLFSEYRWRTPAHLFENVVSFLCNETYLESIWKYSIFHILFWICSWLLFSISSLPVFLCSCRTPWSIIGEGLLSLFSSMFSVLTFSISSILERCSNLLLMDVFSISGFAFIFASLVVGWVVTIVPFSFVTATRRFLLPVSGGGSTSVQKIVKVEWSTNTSSYLRIHKPLVPRMLWFKPRS